MDALNDIVDDRQVAQSQKVHLDQSQFLQMLHRVLRGKQIVFNRIVGQI